MPNKLTDKEIVKALECCKTNRVADCKKCAFHLKERKPNINCVNELIASSIDLINRLQAENKRLSTLAELGNMRANDYRAMRDKCKTAKAEARKEFAERLKEEINEALKSNYKARLERTQSIPIYTEDEFWNYCTGKIDCLRGLDDFLDNILKEMESESNG